MAQRGTEQVSQADTDQIKEAAMRVPGDTNALPLAPGLASSLDKIVLRRRTSLADHRTVLMALIAIALGVVAAWIARLLMLLINVLTDFIFYGSLSTAFGEGSLRHGDVLSPTVAHIGAWVIIMPAIGGLIAGLMAAARWGSRQIQGHGIPEAMVQILRHQSNIAPRVTWLKPLSAVFTIGTGGPFGAEGPIISTGGALGSLFGQIIHVTADERKTLLAAGASAGMAAVFGAPVASMAMAVELLLFEFRPRSLIPVALATVTATAVRYAAFGPHAVFEMPAVSEPGLWAVGVYTVIGGIVGYVSIWVTKAVFFAEDMFGKTHIPWVWWPAIGGLIAGVIGFYFPRTMGVGYDQIDALVSGQLAFGTLLALGVFKFLAWAIALGSNTSGGTLAPLFITGGSLGSVLGIGFAVLSPAFDIDPRIAAVVGMGAIFAGSARAMLTSVIFCFETTRQIATLLPLLGGCALAYLVSALFMRNTIMTEKIIGRGVRVPSEIMADFLDEITVKEACNRPAVSLRANQTIGKAREFLRSGTPGTEHHGYPLLDSTGYPTGILLRREFMEDQALDPEAALSTLPTLQLIGVNEEDSLRVASDIMSDRDMARLIVFDANDRTRIVGILTRHDVLSAQARRVHESRDEERTLRFGARRHGN